MYEIHLVRAEDEEEILNFELSNRDYFVESINDRGDEYFEQFSQQHRDLLAHQEARSAAFYILVADDGTIAGRFNLYDLTDATANVGYRVARDVAGHGVATYGLENLCRIAAEQYGLRTLRATTSQDNVASQRVLEKSGFVIIGSAPIPGQIGILYELDLSAI
jgi:[ribosomal protein S5]-alanine N-acetyltransferase